MGVIATWSPARALTLPAVPRTSPSAASRRQAAATCLALALEASRRHRIARGKPARIAGGLERSHLDDDDSPAGASSPARSARRRRGAAGPAARGSAAPRPAPARHGGTRRRRRRRRGLRRAHRGPRDRPGRPVGRRARGARPRRRPRARTTTLGGGEISERGGDLRRARPRTTSSRSPRSWASARSTPTTRATTSTSPTASARLQRHRPDRHGAARPGDPARPRHRRHPARPDVDECRSTRRGSRRSAARLGRPDARELDQRRTAPRPSSAASCPLATRPIFGAEPRELSLLFVALLHRRVGQRARTRAPSSATSTRATARRCGASSAARSRSPQRMAPQLGQRIVAAARRCGGSCRTAAA